MSPVFLRHKKSGIVHIAYDDIPAKYLQLYCGKEINTDKASVHYPFDLPREEFCQSCVSRYQRKFGCNPGWME